ncbi:hypothetical protein C0Q96_12325 [Streptomyces albidoflavus]|nr:hypothetical protein C0Q96_12325 [Streptomyces albidoflavus]
MWLRRDWGCSPAPGPDWPQAPAGLGFGVAGLRPCVPARAPAGHRWPQSPAGLSVAELRPDRAGQRLASNAGRAIGFRGAFAGWVGRGRTGVPPHKLPGAGSVASRRPSTAVCCGGTPARPRPSVSSASPRRWVGKRQGRRPLIFVASESEDGGHCGEALYR